MVQWIRDEEEEERDCYPKFGVPAALHGSFVGRREALSCGRLDATLARDSKTSQEDRTCSFGRPGVCRMTTTTSELKANSTSACCRICYEDGSLEELIEPCECSGTLGLIHASCLERWLSTWNTDRCEICKYSFAVERRTKPLQQSFWQWWRTRGLYGPQGVTGDAVCLVVLTPLCLAATYLCGIGASAYSLSFWEGTGLAILCCMLVVTYLFWLFITLRFHFKSWKQWCRRNQDVKLLVKCKLTSEERKDPAKDGNRRIGNIAEDDADHRGVSCVGKLCSWFDFSLSRRAEPIYNFHQQTTFV